MTEHTEHRQEKQRQKDEFATKASLAGRAIIGSETEGSTERINQQAKIVSFGDTERGHGASGILFNKSSTDKVSFRPPEGARHKYIDDVSGTYLVATESGNQYIISADWGMVINTRDNIGYILHDGFIPDIAFGEQWNVGGDKGFTTTRVTSLLAEYKIGGVPGATPVDSPSPFTAAHKIIDEKVEKGQRLGVFPR